MVCDVFGLLPLHRVSCIKALYSVIEVNVNGQTYLQIHGLLTHTKPNKIRNKKYKENKAPL